MASRPVSPEVPDGLGAVEVLRLRLPLVEPFVASHGTEHERDLILVHAIGEDGVDGWGECDALSATTYTEEDADTAWAFLTDQGVAKVLARQPIDVADAPMAWTAIEVALLDLALRRDGVSLAAHLGASRLAVPCGAVVGRQRSIDALLDVVARRLSEGAAMVKLKIGPGWDIEPLRAVRDAHPTLSLCADANGSYGAGDLALQAVDALQLTYLEQPFTANEIDAVNEALAHMATPIALDESVASSDDLDRFTSRGLVLNVKPGRLGGVREAQRVIDRCAAEGIDAFVGGMLEGGVGRAVALALAGIESLTLPTDLGPSARYFAEDITAPFVPLADGTLAVPDGPGIGVVPRTDRLAELTTDRVLIRR
jgi:O-succinylbenzoate synthase